VAMIRHDDKSKESIAFLVKTKGDKFTSPNSSLLLVFRAILP